MDFPSAEHSSTGVEGDSAVIKVEPPISTSTTSAVLSLSDESTILSPRIANLITALASSTRLTLSGIAFFIETILETSQFSTRLSLGYTRKFLISAITSARRVYQLSNAALSGDVLTLLDYKDTAQTGSNGDAFLQVLDRYTNLGIYVIHHTFTLAELFTMSSFYIAGSAVSSGLAAARESVGLLDSIFGSNESSRTLASIITLVKREVMLDERSEGKRGVVRTLGGLTRAMTAFAVLQNATWARTEKRISIIHDFTVQSSIRVEGNPILEDVASSAIEDSRDERATPGPGPSTMASRRRSSTPTQSSPTLDPAYVLPEPPCHLGQSRSSPELDYLADELEELMGRDDILEVADGMSESIVIDQLLERVQAGRISPLDVAEDGDWIEVDEMLGGADTSTRDTAPVRPISPKDATDHPRLHIVLENMTRRIIQRRESQRSSLDRGIGMEDRVRTPLVSPHRSPDSSSPRSTPSKRSSPSKAIGHVKAFARRLRFRTTPPDIEDSDPQEDRSPTDQLHVSEYNDQPGEPTTTRDIESMGESPVETELPIDEQSDPLFPKDSLIANIHRFMRYSSAAYGQHFLRILGLGTGDYNFPSTSRHHFNSWAFAHHTNIAIDSLLHSSHTDTATSNTADKALPLVHYVSVDHSLRSIILTCRGTLGLSDILIDLTCDYQDISLDDGAPDGRYYIHKGMYQSAINLTSRQSTVHQGLIDALTSNPGYGLVVCDATNHDIDTPFVTSLASGLPPGRPIHAYAYGPPALASPDLAKYAEGLITSVVLDKDVVPCLRLGVLRDLKNIALTLREEERVAEEIIGRVAGLYKRRLATFTGVSSPLPDQEAVLSDWLTSLINTMRADMDNDKLYPPGCVYIMEYYEIFPPQSLAIVPNKDKAVTRDNVHRAILRRCESVELRFREPLFTKSMLHDHLPSGYERATQLLYDGLRDATHTS